MKKGDYVLSAALVKEDPGYCILLELLDENKKDISYLRWHGNHTMKNIDVKGLENTYIKVFTYNSEDNVVYIVFANEYKTIAFRGDNPNVDEFKFVD